MGAKRLPHRLLWDLGQGPLLSSDCTHLPLVEPKMSRAHKALPLGRDTRKAVNKHTDKWLSPFYIGL